ncbi:lysophospholipid acyltransferase family protein [bacterium]|nr:lysophospholipid acyltransferase family protein [bacterium]
MSKKTLRRRVSGWTRPLRHGLLLAFAESARRLVCLMPLAWIVPVGSWIGRIAWTFSFGARRLAERQLIETGVARDRAGAKRLAREVFESICMNTIEWMHSTRWPEETFRQRVETDLEPLRRVLAEGRGVIVAMGHIGNWEVQMRAVHVILGKTLYAVMAPQRSEVMNNWLVRQREIGGDKMLSSQAGGLPIIRTLRRNNVIGMLGDQDSKRISGIFVDFFGRPAYTPAGIGTLAHISGAPILPACGWRTRENPNHHILIWGDPIRPDPSVDAKTDALRLTQAYTSWLEARIREHPEQWAWVHDRWKRKPSEQT